MLREFKTFIQSEGLFRSGDRILLALSGGIDSMVMADLFRRAGYDFGIAHCNFGLRGKESDEDQRFVRQYADLLKVPFFSHRFSKQEVSGRKGISVQMAARELRYAWFERIRKKNGYACVATAHHLDDQSETFFINLVRGTGIAGLHGIFPKQETLIRPMMFADRAEISSYAEKHRIIHREDRSNAETKYIRNKIRHEIIPVLKEINPSVITTLSQTIRRLKETETVFRNVTEEKRKSLVRTDDNGDHISLSALKQLNPVVAFEMLSFYGFNEDGVSDILGGKTDASGQEFFSASHRIVRNRNEIIILPKKEKRKEADEFPIPEGIHEIRKPLHLILKRKKIQGHFIPDTGKATASLDLSKVKFPLTLRRWKKGDSFVPFGMKGKKKLSDYFIDEKLSLPEKENIWLLCSGRSIVWIVGRRPDNRFRVTRNTKEVLTITWVK
jgi:tRNA(Ile)-lysidine synthase